MPTLSLERETPTVCCAMMVKNEKFSIMTTMNSIAGKVDGLVIYDTGSTDNTLELIREFCKNNNLPLHIKEGAFVDFSTSRNVLLRFVDVFTQYDYVLLLDSNDVLQEKGRTLRDVVNEQYKILKEGDEGVAHVPNQGFLVNQNWWNGVTTSYWNVRLILRGCDWAYAGKVHEYISCENGLKCAIRKMDGIVIYQDRINDDNKSKHRFKRDVKILQSAVEENPEDERSVYYLAQTYSCLDDYENAYKYYLMRSKMGGFYEEVYNAIFQCGRLNHDMKKDWMVSMNHFLEAFTKFKRAEPVAFIAEYYRLHDQFELSYTFAMLACSLPYPTASILFVDKRCYDYMRWHTLSISAYYTGNYKVGEDACRRCIEYGENLPLNKSNMNFYEDKKKELADDKIKTS